MALIPTPVPPIPPRTEHAMQQAFPHGHAFIALHAAFGDFFSDADFHALYAACGTPAVAPWRLALTGRLQFGENLSDREAADAVRRCIDWKYLLRLELEDPGFDYSVLSEFRGRLLQGGAELLLFERLLERFAAQGLVRQRGTQRTDATHILAAVRNLNRLELVGETVRAALNALAVAAPDWLQTHRQAGWDRRYSTRWDQYRLPKSEKARTELAATIGAEGRALLAAVNEPGAPAQLRNLPAVQVLARVWEQQYYPEAERTEWRTSADLPAGAELINSPYDAEARYRQKRTTTGTGYKCPLTETCDPETPHLISDVLTTAATLPDTEVVAGIQARLAQRDCLPATHVVDMGYTEASAWVQSATKHGIRLLGPCVADSSWQARATTGYALADFTVDGEEEHVRCPQGQVSAGWKESQKQGRRVIQAFFAKATCATCPARALCTRTAGVGRRVKFRVREEHAALQTARQRQTTADFQKEYAVRAGIEGTHSQGVRRCGLRKCRYLGEAKARLQHALTAAALNFHRVGQWLLDTPRAVTRSSPYSRLAAVSATR